MCGPTWKNRQCVIRLKISYGTINTNIYHIIPFTVKKTKLFLLIYKHKRMSILRKTVWKDSHQIDNGVYL